MENISFVLWLVLWPLSYDVSKYMGAKINQINNIVKQETGPDPFTTIVFIGVWVFVAILLYHNN